MVPVCTQLKIFFIQMQGDAITSMSRCMLAVPCMASAAVDCNSIRATKEVSTRMAWLLGDSSLEGLAAAN